MRIAVITAFPFALNPGMISVDRALIDVLQDAGIECEIDLYCLEQELTLDLGYLEMDYAELRDPSRLEKYDRIVYWGDFLHWRSYLTGDVVQRMLRSGAAETADAAREMWYAVMLLENRVDLQKKSVVFGSSIYGLGAAELNDTRYEAALRSLYSNAISVKLRDVLSAGFASQLCEDGSDHFGCDCAFFLRNRAPEHKGPTGQRGYIACSFGRSGSTSLYRVFVALLAEMSGRHLTDVSWLRLEHAQDLDQRIAGIRNAAMVVTDVYHMAVTALREGIPVICLARGTTPPTGTLSDKKKEILMTQHFAGRSLVHQEVLHRMLANDQDARAFAEICLQTVSDQAYQDAISRGLSRHVEAAKRTLHRAIFENL